MSILLALIPISLLLLGLAIWAFAWAVKRGQFDDLDTPALDILADEHERRAEVRARPEAARDDAPDAPPPLAKAPGDTGTGGAHAGDDAPPRA
jgi:cbb3-type cytochrome oxidase maturation protein